MIPTTDTNGKTINIAKVVGKGYKRFWHSKKRYLALKGSRGSKKSTTTSLRQILHIMRYPLSNGVVFRRYEVLHRDSTFAQLKWAINQLGVRHLWTDKLSPMRLIYKPTNQQIMFRGLDNAESITSLTVEKGVLDWAWFEEAYQIEREDDFNKIDLSLRGEMPPGYFRQLIFTFNPWSQHIWLKKRFFDVCEDANGNYVDDPLIDTFTTNYMCNEFLDPTDYMIFEMMKERYPERYIVEGLGGWGITEGLVYSRWRVEDFDYKKMLQRTDPYTGKSFYLMKFGLDFGFGPDPCAFVAMMVDVQEKLIYVFDEVYGYHMTNQHLYDALEHKGYVRERISADSAEPRTINELYLLGLSGIFKAKKGGDSVRAGIRKLQDWTWVIHPRCNHFQIEIASHTWAQKPDGTFYDKPKDDGFHHLLDAARYGTEDLENETFSFDSGR